MFPIESKITVYLVPKTRRLLRWVRFDELNEKRFTKVFVKDKEVVNVMVDPNMDTADINIEDNIFPKVYQPSRFDEFRKKSR